MKTINLLLLVFGLSISFANAQLLYDNFEDTRIAVYGYRDGQFSVVPNPSTTGINGSTTCGQYVRNGSAQYDVMRISARGFFDDLTPYLNGTNVIRLKVYSTRRGVPVQISFEDSTQTTPTNYPAGRLAVFKDTTTLANEWEELEFRLDSRPDINATPDGMNCMLLAFNINSSNSGTYLFDDLQGPEYTEGSLELGEFLLENFEDVRKFNYGFRDGTLSQSIVNPAPNNVNPSPLVGRYVRNAGSRYDVMVCNIDGRIRDIRPYFSNRKKIVMKVYSNNPIGSNIDITLANSRRFANAWPQGRHSIWRGTTTRTGEWENVVFALHEVPDRTTSDTSLDIFVIQFDPTSNSGNTYYFDDLRGFDVDGADIVTSEEFLWDNFRDVRRVRYGLVNGTLTTVPNPNPYIPYAYPVVGSYLRSNNQYDVITMKFPPLEDLASYKNNSKRFTINIYSPAPGTSIGFTLQDSTLAFADNYPRGRFAEFTGITTRTNQWERIVMRRSNIPDAAVTETDVNTMAILLNAGTLDAAQFYIDNLYGPVFFSNIIDGTSKEKANAIGLKCFPVPAINTINVSFNQTEGGTSRIEILELNGKKVLNINTPQSNKGITTEQINISSLHSGLYICKVVTASGISTCKFQVK